MAMSLIFSVVLYATSVHELDKRPSGDFKTTQLKDPDHELDEWIGRRSADSKESLMMRLIFLNLAALVLGSGLSYILARRSLRPIEKALDEQDQLIADASHELRTPITAALLSTEIALRNTTLSLKEAKKVMSGTVTDLKELKRLTDELLNQSTESNMALNLVEIDVHRVVTHAVKKLTAIATARHITIRDDTTSMIVVSDDTMLENVLVILLENAVKYSPDNSVVTVTSHATKAGVELRVSDQGIGIAKEHHDAIFDRFYRVDRSRSQTGGYGLGLSIAMKLLRAMGATIHVKSNLGKGSEFTISLPSS